MSISRIEWFNSHPTLLVKALDTDRSKWVAGLLKYDNDELLISTVVNEIMLDVPIINNTICKCTGSVLSSGQYSFEHDIIKSKIYNNSEPVIEEYEIIMEDNGGFVQQSSSRIMDLDRDGVFVGNTLSALTPSGNIDIVTEEDLDNSKSLFVDKNGKESKTEKNVVKEVEIGNDQIIDTGLSDTDETEDETELYKDGLKCDENDNIDHLIKIQNDDIALENKKGIMYDDSDPLTLEQTILNSIIDDISYELDFNEYDVYLFNSVIKNISNNYIVTHTLIKTIDNYVTINKKYPANDDVVAMLMDIIEKNTMYNSFNKQSNTEKIIPDEMEKRLNDYYGK